MTKARSRTWEHMYMEKVVDKVVDMDMNTVMDMDMNTVMDIDILT